MGEPSLSHDSRIAGVRLEQHIARRLERRRSSRIYWGADRRSGFDRRGLSASDRMLMGVRENPVILLTLLIALNVMNLLDFFFTVGALQAGYAEGNPVMALMFAQSHALAGAFKFAIVAIVSVVVWAMRRYRSVLRLLVLACAQIGRAHV